MKIIFILLVLVSLSYANTRAVTHDDIRDAILSLVNMFRDTGDKLERHEYRERQLGEQLKKALVGLDKRHRTTDNNLEAITQVINRMDERLVNLEKMIAQRDERERIQLQKTTDTMEAIQNTLQSLIGNMGEGLQPSGGQDQGSGLNNRMEYLVSSVQHLEAYVRKVSDAPIDSDGMEALRLTSENLQNALANADHLLKRYETRLAELQGVPHQGSSLESQDWHAIFLTALEAHQKLLQDLKKQTEVVTGHLHSLPDHDAVRQLSNSTHDLLQEIRYEIAATTEKGIAKLDTKISETQASLGHGHEELLKTITDANVIAEGVYGDITRSYEELLKEVRRSGEVESVLIQTADNVMDTKRRIEYGVHQILLEVGDLVKLHSKELNATVNKRFDSLSSTIVDSQTGGLSNLTSKIETEISQVWRQIGIMYQQLTASAGALDRLQQQTETYVNGSLQTMGSMGGKVTQITGLMSEMDSNLNYLLGRLSLVTQEFNSIKSDLGSALDNIRHAFISVQKKVKEFGKNGIIPIPDSQEIQTQDGDEGNQVSPLNVKAQ